MKFDLMKFLVICAAFVLPTASFAYTPTDQNSVVTPTQNVTVSQADDKDKDKDDDKKKKK